MNKEIERPEDYPYQSSSIVFNFKLNDNGWWTTDAMQQSKKSKDGINWDVAEATCQIIDKDAVKSMASCWVVLQQVLAECGGNLFNYEHSKIYTLETGEEEVKE